jgi:hypothetical protein
VASVKILELLDRISFGEDIGDQPKTATDPPIIAINVTPKATIAGRSTIADSGHELHTG